MHNNVSSFMYCTSVFLMNNILYSDLGTIVFNLFIIIMINLFLYSTFSLKGSKECLDNEGKCKKY